MSFSPSLPRLYYSALENYPEDPRSIVERKFNNYDYQDLLEMRVLSLRSAKLRALISGAATVRSSRSARSLRSAANSSSANHTSTSSRTRRLLLLDLVDLMSINMHSVALSSVHQKHIHVGLGESRGVQTNYDKQRARMHNEKLAARSHSNNGRRPAYDAAHKPSSFDARSVRSVRSVHSIHSARTQRSYQTTRNSHMLDRMLHTKKSSALLESSDLLFDRRSRQLTPGTLPECLPLNKPDAEYQLGKILEVSTPRDRTSFRNGVRKEPLKALMAPKVFSLEDTIRADQIDTRDKRKKKSIWDVLREFFGKKKSTVDRKKMEEINRRIGIC